MIGHHINCFYTTPTSPTEVANIVYSLKNSMCEGFDGLCISPVKETIDLIAVPLSHICNLSFSYGVFPHSSRQQRSSLSSNVMTLLCFLIIGLFPFFPAFPRFLRNYFTLDCLDFLKKLTSLIAPNMASDHDTLLLWLFLNLLTMFMKVLKTMNALLEFS